MTTPHLPGRLAPMTFKLAMKSCQSCKIRKRRCTRELPECRLCVRARRPCLYQSRQDLASRDPREFQDDTVATRSQSVLRNNFPVAFFLDPALFHHRASPPSPQYHVSIPREVLNILGDLDSQKVIAEQYFRSAHLWMPIISRVHFYGFLMDDSWQTDACLIVLLLGMKLILSRHDHADVRPEIYTLAKKFHLEMEIAGCLSIYLMQSTVLTALYEMGHAIYPGAFTTVSTAARHAIALEITGTAKVDGRLWFEQEERNRAWWAVVILDRLVNINFKGRHLCTPDPSISCILPIDDDAWDQGILPDDETRTVFSTPSMKDGRYARLAQAANLLSQVYRHITSPDETFRLNLDNIAQLERTLFALERLSTTDEQENNVCCFCSIATCHSAILLLRTSYLSEPPGSLTNEGKEQSYHAIRTLTRKTTKMIDDFLVGKRGTTEKVPPLVLDWLYRPAVAHTVLAHSDPLTGWERDIPKLRDALQRNDKRWKAATYYLRLLDTRQAAKVGW